MSEEIRPEARPTKIDSKAEAEEKKFYEKDLERNDSRKGHLHRASIFFIWVICGILIAVLFTRIYHMLSPDNWHWLTANQIQEIDKLVFSGAIGGFLGGYFKGIINNDSKFNT